MKLTQFTDYGLRALMVLASEPDKSLNSKQMAAILDVSREHLIKILQRLALGGTCAICAALAVVFVSIKTHMKYF